MTTTTTPRGRLAERFTARHVILPVIHVTSTAQALRNTDIAFDTGAHGVFLIDHSRSAGELITTYRDVRAAHPEKFIGVNFLDHDAAMATVYAALERTDALWADNAEIDDTTEDQPAAAAIDMVRDAHAYPGLYFGGVAFKHQRQPRDLAAAARAAIAHVDVVTTSGTATGSAAELDKIAALRSALGEHPLAVASGITPDNIGDYLPYVDAYLVATGISAAFDELDPAATRALVDAAS